jgi:hypothetical protein
MMMMSGGGMMMSGGLNPSNKFGGNPNVPNSKLADLSGWGAKGIITGVKVIWCNYIVGLEFLFNGQSSGLIKGYNNANFWEENFNLMQGDYLVQVYGRHNNNAIVCIGFKTAKGMTKTWGNPCEGESFTCGLNGNYIQSVRVAASEYITYIEPLLQDEIFVTALRWPFSDNGKYTTSLGKVHNDSEGFDDWDWLQSKFNYAVGEVKIWHDGTYIYGVQFFYLLDGMKKSAGKHCADGNGLKAESLVLNEGEHINKILCKAGHWIDSIIIFTDQGRQLKAGGNGGQAYLAIAPEGHHFVAFGGALGNHLHSLNVYYDEIY